MKVRTWSGLKKKIVDFPWTGPEVGPDKVRTSLGPRGALQGCALYHPLKYWAANKHRFPNLGQIANDVLGIPASTGGLERIFNFASDILSCKRNRTKPEVFEKILYLKRNSYVLTLELPEKEINVN